MAKKILRVMHLSMLPGTPSTPTSQNRLINVPSKQVIFARIGRLAVMTPMETMKAVAVITTATTTSNASSPTDYYLVAQ